MSSLSHVQYVTESTAQPSLKGTVRQTCTHMSPGRQHNIQGLGGRRLPARLVSSRFEKDRTQAAFSPSPVSWRLAVRKSCCSVVSRTLVERCGGSSLPPLGATCRTYKGNYPDIHFFLDSTRIFACAFRLRGRRAAASPMRLPCAMVDTFQPRRRHFALSSPAGQMSQVPCALRFLLSGKVLSSFFPVLRSPLIAAAGLVKASCSYFTIVL